MTRFSRRYRKVARRLSRLELMERSMEDSFDLSPEDLVAAPEVNPRFLDFYGDRGLRTALDRYGVLDALEERGYGDLAIETHAADERHTLLVSGVAPGLGRTHLVELVVRRDRLVPDPAIDGLSSSYRVLTVDWLTLRHPLGQFSARRPRLPGQDAPGLGLGEQVGELLYRAVERLDLDGLVTVAEFFHNAVMYAQETEHFDPRFRGRLDALCALLFEREELTLAQATWAIDWGCVAGAAGPLRWRGEAQLWSRHPELADYVGSDAHRERAAEAAASFGFRLDRADFDARWAAAAEALSGARP